jgi:protein involved in polysaccharide export with SLBB domain
MRRTLAAVALAFLLVQNAAGAALPAASFVHAGDRLHVAVVGEAELTQDVVVADDGTIGLRPGATLSAAITAAGGMASTIAGAYPIARIVNADGTVYHLSLETLLRGGDPSRDIVLRDGSAIYVPGPVSFDIVVLGAVDHPGTISINEGDRLSIAIAKAGNTASSNADLTRVSISRTEPDGKRAAHPVNLYEALEKGDARFDPSLRANDIVYVPVARQSHGNLTNAVFLLSRLFFFL